MLGPLTVWTTAGDVVQVPGAKVRALLAVLLIAQGRPVSADRLAEDLWGDRPPSNPGAALAVKVSQLRRVLEDAEAGGKALVVSGPAGYALRSDEVDALRFVALTEKSGRTDAILTEALELWRGSAYADFVDESFAGPAIARLAEQRLTALEDRAQARLAMGQDAALVGELSDLLAEHPLRERLRAAHMRALYRSGRQTEALDSFQELQERLAEDLGLDPSPELSDLRQAILTQDAGLEAPRSSGNLPAPLGELIGRDDAIARIQARLATDRLVTLTGPGGVGKTRLAVQIAGELVKRFTGGGWLVELAGYHQTCSDALADVVMNALSVRDTSGDTQRSVDRLAAALRERELLLVLDNCEHVIDEAAELVDAVLRAAPGVRVLATSREPLALPGEVVWNVPPLENASAVRLFAARAAAASRDFALDEENAGPVAVLCRRLDGIPLALELAATRVPALGVQGLVARLDDRFRLLATGHRGSPPRQQTLMAMIDWSWELLSEPERLVLRRLAVHPDGCTVEAARAVADLPEDEILELLGRLVDRSMVVAVHGPYGPRYRMLESVAAYCQDRLADAAELPALRARQQRYYVALAEKADPLLRGPDQREWLERLDDEAANFRGALDGAVADQHGEMAVRLATALTWYWFLRGRLTEAKRFLRTALSVADDPVAFAWYTGFSLLQGQEGDVEEALGQLKGQPRLRWFLVSSQTAGSPGGASLAEAMAGLEADGDWWGTAAALLTRAKFAHVRGDLDAIKRDATRASRLFADLGDRWGQLQANEWLAALAELVGDHRRAARLHQEALPIAQDLGLWPDVATRLGWLSWISMQTGDFPQAIEFGGRALRLATEQNSLLGQIMARTGLAYAGRKSGDFALAELHLNQLLDQARDEGTPIYLSMVLVELGFLAEQRGEAAASRALHLEALELAEKMDAPRDTAWALEGLAGALAIAGEQTAAAQVLGAAAAARTAAAMPAAPAELMDVDRITALAREALGDKAFEEAFEAGRELTPAQARQLA
ncbi:BTAD domain-containing putative transcriptional regulator [Fodinicola feengrottensis]|uniref:BTAD domain-containing putative transcriptional regulator n=1 Tax=Fodinicola feengrottensis TaxID=435914 RepID=A0ABP4T6H3_9ACTN